MIHSHTRSPLDIQMRRVLAQLELISAIPAVNYNATSSSDDDPLGRRPPGDLGYAEYARWYGLPFSEPTSEHPGCRSDTERAACLDAAKDELDHLRHGQQVDPERIETHDQARARMLEETEGCSPKDVAQSSWRVSVTILRRARVAAGRDPETGKVTVHDDTPGVDLASRAHQLKDQGLSLRQIALVLDVHKFQVQRLLSRAA